MTKYDILKRFGPYRKPTEETIPKYEQIREKTLELALLISQLCPESVEKKNAYDYLMMARMSANAAIAIHSDPLPFEEI